MSDIQEWREMARELIDKAEAWHLFAIDPDRGAVCMFPVRINEDGTSEDRQLILQQMRRFVEAYGEDEVAECHRVTE